MSDIQAAPPSARAAFHPAPAGIFTVRQLAERLPAFSQASLRWLLFNADSNGLARSGALLRPGRRILIDEAKFVEWLRSKASV
jgi:hypothetical protein